MTLLIETPYFALHVDAGARVVRLVRSSTPLPVVNIPGCLDAMIPALRAASHEPARLGLLVDLRSGPGTNDPAFESTMNVEMIALIQQFRAYAVLVRTAVGVLQVNRLVRSAQPNADEHVFRDEGFALAYLDEK